MHTLAQDDPGDGWWTGSTVTDPAHKGIFPANLVELVAAPKPPQAIDAATDASAQARAMKQSCYALALYVLLGVAPSSRACAQLADAN